LIIPSCSLEVSYLTSSLQLRPFLNLPLAFQGLFSFYFSAVVTFFFFRKPKLWPHHRKSFVFFFGFGWFFWCGGGFFGCFQTDSLTVSPNPPIFRWSSTGPLQPKLSQVREVISSPFSPAFHPPLSISFPLESLLQLLRFSRYTDLKKLISLLSLPPQFPTLLLFFPFRMHGPLGGFLPESEGAGW